MKLPKNWRWIALGIAGVALLALLLRPSALPVETAEVRRDSLSTLIVEEAHTRARDLYVVAAPVAGRLSRPLVEAGESVTRGALLATITPAALDARSEAAAVAELSAAEARRAQAAAMLADAVAAHELAERDHARSELLFAEGARSRSENERAALLDASARALREERAAALRAAEAAVALARAALMGRVGGSEAGSAIEIRAPRAGLVLRVIEASARTVLAGTPVVEIADPAGLEIVIELLTEDALRVPPGAAVTLTRWGRDSTLRARVRLVEPAAFTKISALGVEEQRVNVVAELIDRPAALGTGYRLQAQIAIWSGTDVLVAASAALFRRDGDWHAFVVVDGRAHLRRLRIGHRGTDQTEILEGLVAGEHVIVYPSDLVEDGGRVSN